MSNHKTTIRRTNEKVRSTHISKFATITHSHIYTFTHTNNISKFPFSPGCGHVYSKNAILQWIKTKSRGGSRDVSCPVAGCRGIVRESSLEKDLETEKRTEKQLRQQENGSSQGMFSQQRSTADTIQIDEE